MKLLAREAPEAPQIIKTTATAVSCMPDSESKTLFAKDVPCAHFPCRACRTKAETEPETLILLTGFRSARGMGHACY